MGSQIRSDDEMISAINVTPLVDVVLVLLVTFMITAPIMYQSAFKVNLPSAKSTAKVDRVTLRFALSKDGKLASGNRVITRDEVASVVKGALAKDPQADAVVSADTQVEHGAVVSLIDSIRGSGITKFSISVRTAATEAKNKK